MNHKKPSQIVIGTIELDPLITAQTPAEILANPPKLITEPIEFDYQVHKNISCPSCGRRHIDEGEFATRVHRTHRCVPDSIDSGGCGYEWRIDPPAFGVLNE